MYSDDQSNPWISPFCSPKIGLDTAALIGKNILTNELNQDKTEKFKMNESKISPKDNYSLHNKTANKILIYLAQQISTESATRSFIQVSKSAGGGSDQLVYSRK